MSNTTSKISSSEVIRQFYLPIFLGYQESKRKRNLGTLDLGTKF